MSYLLDTNVISEPLRLKAHPGVLAWLDGTPASAQYLSVLTLGEIRKGLEKMSIGRRREQIRVWLEHDLPDWFGPRLLPISAGIADLWGRLAAGHTRTLPVVDTLLAATALDHGLCLVTRNVSDFDIPGLQMVNPWDVT